MTVSESIKILERRMRYLSEKVKRAKKNLTLDRRERAALKRAIELMEEYLENELDDDERSGLCLGEQVFGRNWRDDIALTEEERKMLS